MKVLIVGGVAGGASTAARLRRVDENAEIILFERGPYVSFANCGLPYQLGGVIPQREQLLVSSAQELKEMLNVEARVNNEVIAIDRAAKKVTVKEQPDGRVYEESYDKLLLSPGAVPIVPPLPGVNLPGVFVLHNIPELDAIKDWLGAHPVKNVVVVGGGFIGLEVAENLVEKGYQVAIVEMLNQVMAPVDYDIAADVHADLKLHNVDLHLGDGLKGIEQVGDGLAVNLTSGGQLAAGMVVLAIGVRPDTRLAKEAGLEVGPRGHIVTDNHMRTSDPDIYAVGDAVEVVSFITGQKTALALAGPASKEARVAADNIAGRDVAFNGVQGTSVVKIFDLTVASTGLNSRQLEQAKLPFNSVTTHNNDHASYYPGAAPLHLKLLFGPEGQIYGAQAVGTRGVEKRVDVIATAIRGHMTTYDLEELELSYAPPFGASRDPVNQVGFAASNVLRGDVQVKHWEEVSGLKSDEWFFLDVRQPEELAIGEIPGAKNIPLQQLREHLDELPRDRKILVNCQSGQRSYFATRLLRQKGFDAYNLTGGYKTWSHASNHENNHNHPTEPKLMNPVLTPTQTPTAAAPARELVVDACGLQCPGPILKLANQIKTMQGGDVVTVKATDLGFASDVQAWSTTTGNTLLGLATKEGYIEARVQKGLAGAEAAAAQPAASAAPGKDLTMVVFSGDLDKALAAFIIANGFAAMGQKATLFFTFWGLNLLRKDNPPAVKKNLVERMFGWMMPRGASKPGLSQMGMLGAGTAMIKGIMKKKNVDSLPEMLKTAQANGVKLLACQMSMDLMGIRQEELIDGVELAGVATMAAAATVSNTHYFI